MQRKWKDNRAVAYSVSRQSPSDNLHGLQSPKHLRLSTVHYQKGLWEDGSSLGVEKESKKGYRIEQEYSSEPGRLGVTPAGTIWQ